MARITVEDCLERVENRFGLIHLAAKRVRQLRKGSEPLVVCKNKDIVVALREIASGQVIQTFDQEFLETESEATPDVVSHDSSSSAKETSYSDETTDDQGAASEEK